MLIENESVNKLSDPKVSNGKKNELFLYLGIFFTIILQIPSLSTNAFLNILMYSLWTIIIIISVVYYFKKISFSMIVLLFSLLPVVVYSLVTNFFFQKEVFFLKELFFVIIMIFLGYILSDNSTFKINKLVIVYVFTVLFVVGDAYINYLKGHLLDSINYLYPFKNSLGVILVNSIFFLILLEFQKKSTRFFLKIVAAGYLIMLFSLQNRTGILALILGIVAIFFFKKKKINQLVTLSLIIMLVFLNFFYGNSETFINKVISKGLMLETLEAQGVSGWSSRRISMIDYGMNLFSENALFGSKLALSKDVYIESFYVQVLSSYGLIGFLSVLIFFITLTVLIAKIAKKNRQDKLVHLSLALYLSMLTIAFFEQVAPFGPGGVYFINWIIIGFLIGKYSGFEKKGDV